MKASFRITLSTLVVGLVTAAVAAIGIVSYTLGEQNATDLSTQILDQTLHRIDLRIRSFLEVAVRQTELSRRMLSGGQLSGSDAAVVLPGTRPSRDDFERIAVHFAHAMRVQAGLTNLGLGLEATGEYCMVARKPGGLEGVDYIRFGEGERDVRVDRSEFGNEGRRPTDGRPYDGYDPRRRPFYTGARSAPAGEGHWTEAYLFFGAGGRDRLPGVTFGRPIRAGDELQGVMNADFDLYTLCRFLDDLRGDVPGFAFVVEMRADGSRRPIAHPDPATLLHSTQKASGAETHELVETADQAGDARVRAFMALMPEDLARATSGPGGAATLTVREGGEEFLGGYRLLGGENSPRWAICMMVPRAQILEGVERNNRWTLAIGIAGFVVAVLLSVWLAGLVSTPLARIGAQSEAIGQFRLDAPPLGGSAILELDRLMTATEEMKAGLRSFERYAPARLVREMVREGVVAELGGETRTLTVFFSHIAGFGRLLTELPTEELVEHLGEYFTEVSEAIASTHGTLDKYMGDAVMAFWGAPQPLADHALAACRAALRGSARVARLRARWAVEGKREFHACVGLNTGELVVGNMGSPSHLSYTVIGDAVNLAARLEGLNKVYGTEILMSERTFREVEALVVARLVDRVAVKGKTEGVAIYELLGMRAGAPSDVAALADRYDAALATYFAGNFEEAELLFGALLADHPDDGPARLLRARCERYMTAPPPADWGGVFVMTTK
ncbi:MAG: adenylate/guanylate cyclase domain-containing protein [Planctomycetota bacterium]|jgi:adenylate cyclase